MLYGLKPKLFVVLMYMIRIFQQNLTEGIGQCRDTRGRVPHTVWVKRPSVYCLKENIVNNFKKQVIPWIDLWWLKEYHGQQNELLPLMAVTYENKGKKQNHNDEVTFLFFYKFPKRFFYWKENFNFNWMMFIYPYNN